MFGVGGKAGRSVGAGHAYAPLQAGPSLAPDSAAGSSYPPPSTRLLASALPSSSGLVGGLRARGSSPTMEGRRHHPPLPAALSGVSARIVQARADRR